MKEIIVNRASFGDGWISVEDGLPDDTSVDVLVCDCSGACTVACMGTYYWTVWDQSWKSDEITHWMPLPEPPKN